MTKKLLLASLLVTGAIAAGCGGGGYGDQASTASTPAAARSASTIASAAKIVEMTDTTFKPADVQMKVGETVTFVNKDEIAHTATADNGEFDSGTLQAGAKFSFTASKAGTIGYVCVFHPGMTGTITVT